MLGEVEAMASTRSPLRGKEDDDEEDEEEENEGVEEEAYLSLLESAGEEEASFSLKEKVEDEEEDVEEEDEVLSSDRQRYERDVPYPSLRRAGEGPACCFGLLPVEKHPPPENPAVQVQSPSRKSEESNT